VKKSVVVAGWSLAVARACDRVLTCAKRGGIGENLYRLAKRVFYSFLSITST